MAITAESLQDLLTTTLAKLDKPRFVQLSQNLVNYEVWSKMLRKDRITVDSGVKLQWRVMVGAESSAKHVGLYAEDSTSVADIFTYAEVPWRHSTNSYAFEVREMLMNRGAQQIVNLVKARRIECLLKLAELLEETMWSAPDASDDTSPYGLPYWVVKNANEGFNGGTPSGFTTVANINPSTYPKWKNYTGTYSNVTKDDLIKKMRKAKRLTNFLSPVDVPDLQVGRGKDYRIYVNEETFEALEAVGEAQNENLGRDLVPLDGNLTFARNPIIYVPYLDNDSENPVYMINFQTFGIAVLAGDYLRETGPKPAANQHNVMEVHIDLTWQTKCIDRRRNAVFYQA